MTNQRLAVLYEHPDWFKPLFAELNRRSIIYVPLYAEELSYDPAVRSFAYSSVTGGWILLLDRLKALLLLACVA